MRSLGVACLEEDLRRHLQHKGSLLSPEFNEVVADVMRFMSAVFRDGFRGALAQLAIDAEVQPDRPFIQVCEAIVGRHVRVAGSADRELIGKSLLEAYILFAGPQLVFEPASKTRFRRSLRRRGPKGFAALFLSLHLFNVVCQKISDDVAAGMPDLTSVQLYMLGVEAICADVVTRAMTLPDGKLDEQWAAAVAGAIEVQLFYTTESVEGTEWPS